MAGASVYVTPPALARFPEHGDPLEYSSRSLLFAQDGDRVLRAWGRPARPWVIAVEPAGERWKVDGSIDDPPAWRRAVRTLFSFHHPLERFYALVRSDPVLRGTERRFRGLRLPRDASVYESLLHSIVSQQISLAAAESLRRRLHDRTEAYVRWGRWELPCVPLPSRVRSLGEPGLVALGLSRAKARALVALAERERRASLDDPSLAVGPLPPAVQRLDGLFGVGRWTAENALLRGVGRRDVFVAGDVGVRVALARYGSIPREAPEADARAWALSRYPTWGSYATLYLWRRLTSDRRRPAGSGGARCAALPAG